MARPWAARHRNRRNAGRFLSIKLRANWTLIEFFTPDHGHVLKAPFDRMPDFAGLLCDARGLLPFALALLDPSSGCGHSAEHARKEALPLGLGRLRRVGHDAGKCR